MSTILKRYSKIFFKIIAICVILTRSSAATLAPRIINGEEVMMKNAKFQVSVRLKRYDTTFGNGHICGGSLVGPNKVLTAAHCLYDSDRKRYRKASEFVVVMGTLNRYQRVNGTIVSNVKSIAYMTTFNNNNMRDDVGLMFLKTGLPANKTHLTIAPITLTNTSTPAGMPCQVYGWGKTEQHSSSPILLVGNVTTILTNICSFFYNRALLDGMMCAGHMLGGVDSCQGDSGGPLVHNNTLIGIVSWGWGCGKPGFPGIYTDVHYYSKWIMEHNSATNNNAIGFTLILSVYICLYYIF